MYTTTRYGGVMPENGVERNIGECKRLPVEGWSESAWIMARVGRGVVEAEGVWW